MLIFADPRQALYRTKRMRAPAAAVTGAVPEPLTAPSAGYQAGLVRLALALVFLAVSAKLVHLGMRAEGPTLAALSEPVALTVSRPDIVDRNGRLLATDVEVYSLFADPARVIDRDEAVETLAKVLPDLNTAEVLRALADTSKRFVWVKRQLPPKLAQVVHDLGLPGFQFRKELRRAYPMGALAGHILGGVNINNRGVAGLERYIDDNVGVDPIRATRPSERPPVRLSIEVGAQAALEAELDDAMKRFDAPAAAAVVLDVRSGEIVAGASLPRIEPARALDALDQAKRDRLQSGTYELGSIFKTMTLAMALDAGDITPESVFDVRQPLTAGRFEIKDLHPAARPLSVTEIFLQSSNVGAGMIALQEGTSAQQAFLARMGLISRMATEAGPVAAPVVPDHWDRTETITIAYGHGIAVAPLQFATAAAALINGGTSIEPTYLLRRPSEVAAPEGVRVVSAGTSAAMRTLMRENVTGGTGKRAEVPGYEVGGKTGTADIAGPRGYHQGGVISSFLATFPTSAPRYVMLVLIFEPKPTAESGGKVLAGLTAAPAAGRIIARIGPLLSRL